VMNPRAASAASAWSQAVTPQPAPNHWIRQVHPTARSKSFWRSKINAIRACAQPKVPSFQVLRPFWKTIVPALRRFAHAAKQTKPASAAEGSLDGGGFPERRTVCTDPAPGTARPPRMGRTPNPALLNPER
jgi:hypothetical protein